MASLTLLLPHSTSVRLAFARQPNVAVVAGTIGCALISLEFNRPGRIFPAACGLLLLLFASAGLMTAGAQPAAFALLLTGAAGLLINAWRRVPLPVLALAAAAVIGGLRFLLPAASPTRIHLAIAVACGGFLGVVCSLLTRIAYRARRAKALD